MHYVHKLKFHLIVTLVAFCRIRRGKDKNQPRKIHAHENK